MVTGIVGVPRYLHGVGLALEVVPERLEPRILRGGPCSIDHPVRPDRRDERGLLLTRSDRRLGRPLKGGTHIPDRSEGGTGVDLEFVVQGGRRLRA